jgi:uncharacterized membrane protein YfcA
MNNPYPHELMLGDVYLAPFLPAFVLAFLAALVSAALLNKLRLARFFYAPSYVFIAFVILYLILIDHYFIPF